MTATETDALRERIVEHLEAVRAMFDVPVNITIVVRMPSLKDGGVVISDEADYAAAAAEILRLDRTGETHFNMVPVESSNIEGAGWCANILRIRFKSGEEWEYKHVPKVWFDDFLAARSKGKFLAVIKTDPGAHPCRKVS